MQKKSNILIEAFAVLALALGMTLVLVNSKSASLKPYVDLIISATWLYLPVILLLAKRVSFADLALDKINLVSSLKWFLIASVAVFPVFYLACWLGATKTMGWKFSLEIPDNFWRLALGQLLLAALPEELFFRGYLQARFNQVLGKKWKFLSATFGPGLFVTAALFALAHFAITPAPDRILVFFPALLFGWLREKTDSLLAPTLFHFAANITFLIFQLCLQR